MYIFLTKQLQPNQNCVTGKNWIKNNFPQETRFLDIG